MKMTMAAVEGSARAQRLCREVVMEVASTIRPGLSEREAVERLEAGFAQARIRHWLHTPYAWWGERARFAGFHLWEVDALPTERRLEEGEPFVLDAAPLVDGFACDFAYSGMHGGDPSQRSLHQEMLALLARVKAALPGWAREASDGKSLYDRVSRELRSGGADPIHSLYPAGVLGHTLVPFPGRFGALPRIGNGFQLPLIAAYAVALFKHRLLGSDYPFINAVAPKRPVGLFAIEPHIGVGSAGAKFESLLLIDGDETRWLDPGLFGGAA